jgi:hypothetical protein
MIRQQRRTTVSLDIRFEWAGMTRAARICDISIGGCFINSLAPIAIGEVISFRLDHTDGQFLELTGEIVYIYTNLGYGVRFIDLDNAKIAMIENVILMHNGDPWAIDTNVLSRDAAIVAYATAVE